MAKKNKVGVISVEKPTWFPIIDDSTVFPTYGEPVTIGTAVSIKPSENWETTKDSGDSIVQDLFTAFGGAEVSLETNGYANKVLAEITGAKMVNGGVLRSGEDVFPDGAFAYRRKKSNGAYRYTIFYKGQFSLSSDETSTIDDGKVTFTHPEWSGTFVDIPGLGFVYSVDTDDEGINQDMIDKWFEAVMDPRIEAHETLKINVKKDGK